MFPFIQALPSINVPSGGQQYWRVDEDVTLRCQVPGVSNRRISWTWTRVDGQTLPRNSQNRGGDLFLYNIRPQDGGVYVCSARVDGIDSWINSTIQITVRGNSSIHILNRLS